MRNILAIATIALALAAPAKADDCKLTEKQVRELWIAAFIRAKNEDERTRITAAEVRGAENFCRQQKAMKPTPLPPELKALAR